MIRKTYDGEIILDADSEEPDCMCCDHFTDDERFCKKCGPEHWWANFVHTMSADEYAEWREED